MGIEAVLFYIAVPILALATLASVFFRESRREEIVSARQGADSGEFKVGHKLRFLRRDTEHGERVGVWALASALGFLFVVAGLAKLLATSGPILGVFDSWGFPIWSKNIIGMVEIFCGIFLMWRWSSFWAALPLAALMVGAAATHLVVGTPIVALMPLTVLVALTALAWIRRPNTLGGDVVYEELWQQPA